MLDNLLEEFSLKSTAIVILLCIAVFFLSSCATGAKPEKDIDFSGYMKRFQNIIRRDDIVYSEKRKVSKSVEVEIADELKKIFPPKSPIGEIDAFLKKKRFTAGGVGLVNNDSVARVMYPNAPNDLYSKNYLLKSDSYIGVGSFKSYFYPDKMYVVLIFDKTNNNLVDIYTSFSEWSFK